jgi:signal transduction histidine kinase
MGAVAEYSMKPRLRRKQILLFVAALLLPSLILAIFTLRMVRQEKELATKHAGEEKRRVALEIGRAMQSVLENVITSTETEKKGHQRYIVWSGSAHGTDLALPWEKPFASTARPISAAEKRFSVLIGEAEIAEFTKSDFLAAIYKYRQALEIVPSPARAAMTGLSLARSLAKSGRRLESQTEYRRLLGTPVEIADAYGIPVAFYAALPLVQSEGDRTSLVGQAKAWLESEFILPPEAYFRLKDLATTLIEHSIDESGRQTLTAGLPRLDKRIKTAELVLKVKDDFPSLVREWTGRVENSQAGAGHPEWLGYGPSPWLLGLGPESSSSSRPFMAVDGPAVLAAALASVRESLVFPGNCRLVPGGSAEGEDLGKSFSSVRIEFDSLEPALWTEGSDSRATFYFFALAFVIGVALIGAYLLWRDVRRDLRMAEVRSQFVSSVSHELRTPLAAIRMFTDALRLGRVKDPASQQEYLEVIGSESERLSRLINNVLEFGKIERGERDYDLEPTSVEDVVARAVRLMEYPLKQKKFHLFTEIKSPVPFVRADSDALEQALLNLLLNALKYSGTGKDIRLTVEREGDWVVIRVQDSGVGIALEHREKIFERFFRIPGSENRGIAGAGLGLTIVRHIVDGHGGKITVNSEVGRGSTFSIYLPLERAQ